MKNISLLIITTLILNSCGLDCIDNKTGMHKSSRTIADSKKNDLFQFEMVPNNREFSLDSGKSFKIKNAWVESGWTYECINNKAVIQKDSFFQFVIDANYNGDFNDDMWLMEKDRNKGNALGAVLDFSYSGEDTILLLLTRNKTIIDSLILKKPRPLTTKFSFDMECQE